MGDEGDATGLAPTELGDVVPTEAHTELAAVAGAEVGSNYAWALDDDVDEAPAAGPFERMTARRITTLAVTVSLMVAAVAGVLALVMLRDNGANRAARGAPSALGQTVVVAPSPVPSSVNPSLPVPSLTPSLVPVAPTASRAQEESFVAALEGTPIQGPGHISYAMIPGSHGAYMGDRSAWTAGGPVVKYGYEACAVLKKYPNDREQATAIFYQEHGYDTESVGASTKQEMATYMDVVATYLCE